jgi:hypothetical protein
MRNHPNQLYNNKIINANLVWNKFLKDFIWYLIMQGMKNILDIAIIQVIGIVLIVFL